MEKKGLSKSLAEAVKRLFTDDTFKSEALTDPEVAFAHYSLAPEERQALKSLMGKMSGPEPFTGESVWF